MIRMRPTHVRKLKTLSESNIGTYRWDWSGVAVAKPYNPPVNEPFFSPTLLRMQATGRLLFRPAVLGSNVTDAGTFLLSPEASIARLKRLRGEVRLL